MRNLETKLEQYRATLRLAGTEIERRNQVIRGLTSFTFQASRLNEPAGLMKMSLSQAIATTEAQVGAIVLIDSETNKLSLGTHKGLTTRLFRILTGQRFDLGATTLMPHLVQGKGALLEKRPTCEEGERLLLEAGEVTSLVSLPLKAGERTLGALVAGISDEARFTPASLHFLMAIAQETAVALESLNLREKLWHMAETLLSVKSEMSHEPDTDVALESTGSLPILQPLQADLAEIVASIGGVIGAVFILDNGKNNTKISLAANYGLSPVFTSNFAYFLNTDNLFPFDQLALKKKLIVHDILQTIKLKAFPLLAGLQEEGARSLMAIYFENGKQPAKVLMIGATTPKLLKISHIRTIMPHAGALLTQLTVPTSVPTFPTHSIHIPSMERQVTDDDLEKLLAAMMEAEEEVEQYRIEFATLNTISEMLAKTLYLDRVLDKVITKIRELIRVNAAWLYIFDERSENDAKLFLYAQEGLTVESEGRLRHLRLGQGIEGKVAKDSEIVYINDLSQHNPEADFTPIKLKDIQAIMAVPLAYPKEVDGKESKQIVGVLSVGMYKPHIWETRQMRLLTTVANQMAFMINNARMYDHVQETMNALAIGNEFLQKLTGHMMENSLVYDPGIIPLP